MSRQDVLNDIQATWSLVPGWLEQLEDHSLEQEWRTMKGFFLADTTLPVKTKALIGLAVGSAVRCEY